ncbi:hypothetical protein HaLaN_24327 [Haematococcus lacustris]|uniref:Uncharacterized protein n=1 Tax=Haematococcus lacustris TaxID=44745 RepID=A0A699ZTL8_HAELA|nr:hypothetical protein HaLaN_24327 [Haematococcus lacustris]
MIQLLPTDAARIGIERSRLSLEPETGNSRIVLLPPSTGLQTDSGEVECKLPCYVTPTSSCAAVCTLFQLQGKVTTGADLSVLSPCLRALMHGLTEQLVRAA